jgi:hypothetical protein
MLTHLAHGNMKRSAKIWLIAAPTSVFFVSLFFGLLHHFYRYGWAGTLWYYTAMLLVAVVAIELLLIAFER